MLANSGLFNRHYPELDIIRAVAISLVLMRHFLDMILLVNFGHMPGFLTGLFSAGWHGVDLFFALSGFLIGGQIIEGCTNGSFGFGSFFIKRFFRIVPPYFIAIAVYIIFYSWVDNFFLLNDPIVLKDTIIHLLYIQDYLPAVQVYNGIYWSLAVEEKFYFLLPVIVFLILKYRSRASLLYVILGLLAVGVAIRFMVFDPSKHFWSTYLVPFHNRFDNLLFGVLAAFLFIQLKGSFPKWMKYALAAVAAAAIGPVLAFGELESEYFSVCWQFTLSGIGFSALILAFLAFNIGSIPFLKGATALIAKYSYTIYLYHYLGLALTHQFLRSLLIQYGTGPLSVISVFIVYFAAVFAGSAVLHTVIERPCMNIRKWILRKKAAAEAA